MEPETTAPDRWLTIEEAAGLTGRTVADVLHAVKCGEVPGVVFNYDIGWRLPRDEALARLA